MSKKGYFHLNSVKPKVMGIGLLTLDVIMNGGDIEILDKVVGGSMGNVITILSFFGWESYPIAYLGKDHASKIILDDINKWNVKKNYIMQDETVKTPIIVEKINNHLEQKKHEFNFVCPLCHSKLPRNRVIPNELVKDIIKTMPEVQVFYLDRLSRSALKIANLHKKKGAIIFFEPHKVSKDTLFKECLKITDILKYSLEDIEYIPYNRDVYLEIISLGSEGVKYKLKGNLNNSKNHYEKINAYHLNNIVDTAGAGDWLTAGIIHMLGQNGRGYLNNLLKSSIKEAMLFGQSLSALNCSFEGARGLMYKFNKREINEMVKKIMRKKYVQINNNKKYRKKNKDMIICPMCI